MYLLHFSRDVNYDTLILITVYMSQMLRLFEYFRDIVVRHVLI